MSFYDELFAQYGNHAAPISSDPDVRLLMDTSPAGDEIVEAEYTITDERPRANEVALAVADLIIRRCNVPVLGEQAAPLTGMVAVATADGSIVFEARTTDGRVFAVTVDFDLAEVSRE